MFQTLKKIKDYVVMFSILAFLFQCAKWISDIVRDGFLEHWEHKKLTQ